MIQLACATPTAYEIISLGASKAFRSSGVSLMLSFSLRIPSGAAGESNFAIAEARASDWVMSLLAVAESIHSGRIRASSACSWHRK